MSKSKKIRGIKKYLGIDVIQAMNSVIFHRLFKPVINFNFRKKTDALDFEEVIKKYGLSEIDLKRKEKSFLYYSLISLIIGLTIFFYFCLNINKFYFIVKVNYLIIILLLFILSFRCYYFRYLILMRKLGIPITCFIKDILKGKV